MKIKEEGLKQQEFQKQKLQGEPVVDKQDNQFSYQGKRRSLLSGIMFYLLKIKPADSMRKFAGF